MKVHDISMPLRRGMPFWPGDPAPELEPLQQIAAGDPVNTTKLSCCVHVGTHVDAPRHFLEEGAGVEALSFDALVGQAVLVDVGGESIGPRQLDEASIPPGVDRVLLRTENSRRGLAGCSTFTPDFAALSADGARWLVEHDVRLVGIDYLSIQRFDDPSPEPHQILLGAEVVILEGLDLHGAPAGVAELVCLPLLIPGADGAPARAVLIER